MREFLFRGKRVDNGEWVYGSYYHCCGTAYGATFIVVNDFGFIEVIPHTVGQYTGLTDKNGKKIFEGDIVKTKEFGKDNGNDVNFNNFDIFEVIYSSASFKLNNSRRIFNMLKGQGFEVIGNIYDNKDLLKEE